ncbi:hypothetical protein BLNAU_15634 [Blattamonas nauphoetae]|uniref:Uncharacterized protein n=1 Tax=Blattamonas nauphoetae TaxID=2049346 RepID=A0ABQ9XAE4_9EUKA|nr:hypothetical protein BLNAU_15634 [Blattamonas nauphoetae]
MKCQKKKANKRGRPKLEESWESDDETSIEVTSWSGSEESVEEEVKKVKRQTSAVTEDSDSCSSYSVSEELRTTSIITRSRASPELICHKTPVMVDDDSLEEDLDIPPPLHQTESSSPSNSEAEPAPSLDVGYDSDLATSSRYDIPSSCLLFSMIGGRQLEKSARLPSVVSDIEIW